MQYKLKGRLTRKFIPLVASVKVAGLTIKKVRKTRSNKGTKRGPRAKLSPIGLAGMKIMMRRGRAPKVVRHGVVTPGSLMGLAGMKIMPGRKTRKNKGVKRGSRVRKVRSVPTGGARKVRVARRKTRSL
jgi:hypothetical protein